jgi:amino acid adenylation domain-containing protein
MNHRPAPIHVPSSEPPGPARAPGPTNPFVPFTKEDVEQSIPSRFEKQVRRNPHKTAVKTARHELTYEELNRAANRLARAIHARRGPAEEPVAFLLGHGAPQITAILGILKAGKSYVPLDASFPRPRLAYLLEDAQAGLLVTDGAHAALAAELGAGGRPLVNLDELGPGLADEDLDLGFSPDRPAYILYTSGSTGRPKGVFHSHRNVLHFTLRYTNNFHISAHDRLLLLASCGFAGSLGDIFPALLNGATLLPFDINGQGLANLAGWLTGQAVTLYHSVPTVFRHLARTLRGEAFPALRLIRLGGEAVTRTDVELYRKHFGPRCLLAVVLGATEMNIFRIYFVDRDAPVAARVPVGYAPEDTEVLLLDEAGKAVGPGQVGEIAVKSRYLAQGYWRQPELTRAAFQPAPEGGGVRIYRTGDLGLLRPDGCLEHLGRKDDQVKVRGHRVEIAEVEAALLDLAAVKQAAVVAREDPAGGRRLTAYLVPASRPAPAVSALRKALRDRLPDYMVPSAFVFLDGLPTTATGKVDRRALPAPEAAHPAVGAAYAAPQDPVQTMLTEVWEDCLDVRPVGIHDNFLDLGGDSLLAVDMLSRVEALCGKKLPPTVLLGGGTVEYLAGALREHAGGAARPALAAVQAGGGRQPFFFLHGDWHGGGLYCVNLARHLGADRPFYALHPHGLAGPRLPRTIEGMAADRLEALLAFRPEGPYLLGGYCNGGVVAFEMARQLRLRGRRADLVVIVAPPPGMHLAVGPQPGPGGAGGVCQVGSFLPARPRFCRPRPPDPDPPPYDLGRLPSHLWPEVLGVVYRTALSAYPVRRYPGRLVLLHAQDDRDAQVALPLWAAAADNVEVREVPGGHFDVLTRHARALAEQLDASLRAAE